MKALTFASMVLFAISGAAAQSVTAASVNGPAAASLQPMQGDSMSQRICMRCLFGG